jgi:hypothetical protein
MSCEKCIPLNSKYKSNDLLQSGSLGLIPIVAAADPVDLKLLWIKESRNDSECPLHEKL